MFVVSCFLGHVLVLINELFRARELLKSNRGTVFGIYAAALSCITQSMAAKSVYVALPKKITDVRVGSFPALASLAYTNFRF